MLAESELPELGAEPVSPPVDEPDELVLDPLSVAVEVKPLELDVELFVFETVELVVLSVELTGEVLGLGLLSGEEDGAGVASTVIDGLGLGLVLELPTLDAELVESVLVEEFCDPEDWVVLAVVSVLEEISVEVEVGGVINGVIEGVIKGLGVGVTCNCVVLAIFAHAP